MITRSFITKDGNLVICNFSNARIYDYQDVEAEERAMKIIHTINCVPFSDFERVARRHLPEIAKSLSSSMAT